MCTIYLDALHIWNELQNNLKKYDEWHTHVQCGAKRTHVFQIIVTFFIFNIKKLCQHQNIL